MGELTGKVKRSWAHADGRPAWRGEGCRAAGRGPIGSASTETAGEVEAEERGVRREHGEYQPERRAGSPRLRDRPAPTPNRPLGIERALGPGFYRQGNNRARRPEERDSHRRLVGPPSCEASSKTAASRAESTNDTWCAARMLRRGARARSRRRLYCFAMKDGWDGPREEEAAAGSKSACSHGLGIGPVDRGGLAWSSCWSGFGPS